MRERERERERERDRERDKERVKDRQTDKVRSTPDKTIIGKFSNKFLLFI